MWTSTERLYLNADGEVVKANDPTRVSLLCAAGCNIPMASAIALGLAEAPKVASDVIEMPVQIEAVETAVAEPEEEPAPVEAPPKPKAKK